MNDFLSSGASVPAVSRPEVLAVYFPNYHRYPLGELYYGEGWTEWKLVEEARPRFEGHHQPKVPEWGFYDEADPAWSARENAAAADHGITCWLVDWYWYSGVQMMQEQLEQGFLRSENRGRLKFALMWANHPWMDFFPVPAGKTAAQSNCWLPMRHSLQGLERVADYCIEHYFREPNYLQVEGKLYFSFFSYGILRSELGGPGKVRAALQAFDRRVREAGLPGVHFAVNIANVDVTQLCWDVALIDEAKEAGFDSVFGYNITRSQSYQETDKARPLVDYADVMKSHEYLWRLCDGKALPFCPTVTMGCDVTPRWHRDVSLPLAELEYPYEPVVVNNTPERYGVLCEKALEFLKSSPAGPRLLFLNGWNEWTEGNFLCPEQQYGDGYLKALRAALARSSGMA